MKTHIVARNSQQKVPGALDFYVDFATGELSGESARLLKREFELYARDGMAHFAWQQSYPAPDPLHNPASMSMILKSWGYADIEGELGDLEKYPWPMADEIPYGSVA